MRAMGLLLLLLLLLHSSAGSAGPSVSSDAPDCGSRAVTEQLLDGTLLERTWQPNRVSCPRSGRWSESDPLPHLMRSGPRWLLMQLRRAVLLHRLTLQTKAGEWLPVGSAASLVSAAVAASLPLRLQLEDPCQASWEAFQTAGVWRQLGPSGEDTAEPSAPASFIMLSSSDQLDFTAIKMTSRLPPVQLKHVQYVNCFTIENMPLASPGDKVCFDVSVCDTQSTGAAGLFCSITLNGKEIVPLKPINPIEMQKYGRFSFEFDLQHRLHGSVLSCKLGHVGQPQLLRTLVTLIDPKEVLISASPVWVSGRHVTVTFITVESIPEPQHTCWIGDRDEASPGLQSSILNATSTLRSVVSNSKGQYVLTVKSVHKFVADKRMLGKSIICQWEWFYGSNGNTHIRTSKRFVNIRAISEPCVTSVHLQDTSQRWREGQVTRIRVTSRDCSTWSTNHTCWIMDSSGELRAEQLDKINETDFSSLHQLLVTRWMGERDWLVRCRVTQSGLPYDDVESRGDKSNVLYAAVTQLSAVRLQGQQLMANVTSSGGRPRVSKVTCNVTDVNLVDHRDDTEMQLTDSGSDFWSFKLCVTQCEGYKFNISCRAEQIEEDHELIYAHEWFSVSEFPAQSTSDPGPSPEKFSNIYCLPLMAIVTAVTMVISCAVAWKLSKRRAHAQLASGQCRCGAMQLRPRDNPMPAAVSHVTAEAATAAESHPYDEPSVNTADPYEQVDESAASHVPPQTQQETAGSRRADYVNWSRM